MSDVKISRGAPTLVGLGDTRLISGGLVVRDEFLVSADQKTIAGDGSAERPLHIVGGGLPIEGTGTSTHLAAFTAATTIGDSAAIDDGANFTIAGRVIGINTRAPAFPIDIETGNSVHGVVINKVITPSLVYTPGPGVSSLLGVVQGLADTTTGILETTGVIGSSATTKTAGAAHLINIGGLFTASGGDENVALWSDFGDVRLNVSGGITEVHGAATLYANVNALSTMQVGGLATLSSLAVSAATNYTGIVSVASITGAVVDYNPTGLSTASTVLQPTTGPATIRGIVSTGSGRQFNFYNTGGDNITLSNEDAGEATAARRIIGIRGADTILAPKDCATLLYDGSVSRWRIVSRT